MSWSSRLTDRFFSFGAARARSAERAVSGGLLICTASALWLGGAAVAYGGPCTAQIARVEQRIKQMPAGPQAGPTWSQTLGAQLHNQPTPRDVEHAKSVAKEQAQAALDSARQADADGNADACNAALTKVRRLYGID